MLFVVSVVQLLYRVLLAFTRKLEDLRFLVRMVGVWMTRHVGESCPRGEEGVSGGG